MITKILKRSWCKYKSEKYENFNTAIYLDKALTALTSLRNVDEFNV